jgi:hypothetical protein
MGVFGMDTKIAKEPLVLQATDHFGKKSLTRIFSAIKKMPECLKLKAGKL